MAVNGLPLRSSNTPLKLTSGGTTTLVLVATAACCAGLNELQISNTSIAITVMRICFIKLSHDEIYFCFSLALQRLQHRLPTDKRFAILSRANVPGFGQCTVA